MICLREPSLGPYFGIKGGGTGDGRAQVVPAEDINLHFVGDMYAVEKANNLLCAMVDNHLQHGNELGLDPRRIVMRRVIDLNERSLRDIVIGLGGPLNGVPRRDGFNITPASEVMAILCLARDFGDLGRRMTNMVVGFTYKGEPVRADAVQAVGAMQVLLRDAIHPNLVQSLEGTPAFVHGGPFANIAQGTNTCIATRLALKLADYVVTEAGFATDLGAEKFIDIKCRTAGLKPGDGSHRRHPQGDCLARRVHRHRRPRQPRQAYRKCPLLRTRSGRMPQPLSGRQAGRPGTGHQILRQTRCRSCRVQTL